MHRHYTHEQLFNDRFPLSIVAVLAIIQMLTTFGIIGLEIGHVIINMKVTNLFAGIWTSVPFTILWISMFAAGKYAKSIENISRIDEILVCCCRRKGCAANAVVQNCISLVFAAILIGINIAFLYRPNHCFFTTEICENLNWVSDITLPFDCFNDTANNCDHLRLTLIKAQLSCAITLAVTCLIYLILYIVVSSRAKRAHRRQAKPEPVVAPVYQPPPINYQIQTHANVPQFYPPTAPPVQYVHPMPVNGYPTLYPNIGNDRF